MFIVCVTRSSLWHLILKSAMTGFGTTSTVWEPRWCRHFSPWTKPRRSPALWMSRFISNL